MSPPARAPARRSHLTVRLEKQVLGFIRDRDVIRTGESVVVGLSGGPDSTALIVLLSRIRGELGLRITAAHFDHRLRSRQEADEDRDYVEALCRRLRVKLVTGGGDVKGRVRRHRETIEEAARNLRYRFLGREAKRAGATSVAVGHTLDDRAETVILNLIRGAGLDGLATMSPRSRWPFGNGPDIARPLLGLTRQQVEQYCEGLSLEPRVDPTNELPIATRNRIRRDLMPALRALNPKAPEALARLADAAGNDSEYLEALADQEWQRLAKVRPTEVTLARDELNHLARPIAARILRRAAANIGAQPEARHLEEILSSLSRRRFHVSIPGGRIELDSNGVTVSRGTWRKVKPVILPNKLSVPGRTRAGGWTFEATKVERDAARPRDAFSALLDVDAVDGPLEIRSRKPGDRLRPLGLNGTKKLQDILVDAKVPQAQRDAVPVIADRLGIVWVAGHCIDQRVAVSAKTRRVMRLRARRKSSR